MAGTEWQHDAAGNLTKDATYSYFWDYENRRGCKPRRGRRPHLMTSCDGPGTSNDTTYRYDAQGRRITKDVNGSKTAYFHDALDVVAEHNGNDQLQRTYVTPGLDDNLTMTASGSTYYYLKDALGSIRQVVDANEATQNSYDYEAFGKVYGSPTENVTRPFHPYTVAKHLLLACGKWFAGWETEYTVGALCRMVEGAGSRIENCYGDWLVPSFFYRSLRHICQTLGWGSLPLYPKRSRFASAVADAVHRLLDHTWLQLHTAACIGVICRKQDAD